MKNNLWCGRIDSPKNEIRLYSNFKNYEVNCLFPVIHYS